jgi:hypothetical protein
LTRIKHLGDIEDYNSEFQVLATRVDNISDEHLLESYMGGLKEDIKHEIFLKHPENIMEAMQFAVIFKPRIRLHTSLPLEHMQEAEIILGFIRQPYLNLLKYHRRKWRKEEKKDYALVVTTNGQKGINVKKQNCSPWKIMMKRKWRHLHKEMRKNLST